MATFLGKYRAEVISVEDPLGLMRTKIRVGGKMDALPVANLPWAECVLPSATSFNPFVAGNLVWVEFPYEGDSRRPLIVGFAQDATSGSPNISAEASGQGDVYTPSDIDGAPDAATATATKDYVYSRFGLMEIRNQNGGWSMTNTKTGTTIGMNDAGEAYLMGVSTVFINSGTDTTIQTGGKTTVKSAGDVSVSSESKVSITAASDMDITVGGKLAIKAAAIAMDEA